MTIVLLLKQSACSLTALNMTNLLLAPASLAALFTYDASVVAVFGAVVATVLIAIHLRSLKWKRMPPGPKPVPFIGNTHQVPSVKPWWTFEKWNKEYGPVISFWLGGTPVIVLGTAQAAWDLLDKRSDIYSSRPRFVVAGEILSNNMRGLMLPYGEAWRRWRKVLHSGFHSRRAEAYTPIQSLEGKITLVDMLSKPQEWERNFRRYAASVVTSVTYGRRINSIDEWIVKENIAAMDYLMSVNIPGKYLVESWPWLLKLPRALQWFRREPEEYQQRDIKLYTSLLDDVKTRMNNGTAPDCLTSQTLLDQGFVPGDDNGSAHIGRTLSELDIAYAVSSPFGAGIDTTAGTLSSFVLAMLHFPEVQAKAQRELDTVIGPSRMPEYEDKGELPYIRAIVDETLRWRPVAVLGGSPHAVTADDEYKGMFIPKGSTVFANMAGIMRDPNMFPSPDDFIPERFLISSPLFNPRFAPFDLPFGFGRRVCPGSHLARNSLFISIARLLWAFHIKPATDKEGKEVLPDPWNYTNGFNSFPVSFQCKFEPRSREVVGVIKREGAAALDELNSRWT
ncbi:cytochrome P450 [Cristinia sonorae]|uniref:Cytochrome P450 n=1 Tax=Cristinia sonorae TaxID=1940300 RepID=A0A8K0XQW8_9AGAR|nr:cytochrome P450 [Cristinia sonorae]